MIQRSEREARSDREACCAAVPQVSMEAIERDVTVLSALANPTRYGALRVLRAAEGEVCACDLAEPLDASQSAISHALSALYEAGLVTRRKQGRWRHYSTTALADRVLAVFDDRRNDGNERETDE